MKSKYIKANDTVEVKLDQDGALLRIRPLSTDEKAEVMALKGEQSEAIVRCLELAVKDLVIDGEPFQGSKKDMIEFISNNFSNVAVIIAGLIGDGLKQKLEGFEWKVLDNSGN